MHGNKIAAVVTGGALAFSLAAAPVMAVPGNGNGNGKANGKKPTGAVTTIQFTKSVKTKLKKDGIAVVATAPAKKRNAVTFTLPATQEPGSTTITHTGTLALARADRSVEMKDIVFDMKAGTVNYTQADGTVVTDVFDLAKVKTTKKTVKANLVVAAGQAAVLNEELSTTLFKDGMFVAKADTKFRNAA